MVTGMKLTLISKTIAFTLLTLGAPSAFAENTDHVPVTVGQATTQTFTSSINEVGKIRATDSAALTFSASEKLLKIHFKDGDFVKKGDVIAQLDDTTAKADLDKAKSSLALAKSKLKRVQELLKKQPDSMSQQDVEELKEQANLAAADFRQKEALMNNYVLVAPFDGQLTNFSHSVGSRIDSSNVLVSLIKLDPVEVQYSIGQSDLGSAKLGQNVSIEVDSFAGETFKGVVDYIAPAVDESSGRVEIHAHIKNPEHRLVPGMFAKLSQVTSDEEPELVVSQNAVLAKDNTRFVWVVNGETIEQRVVELGVNTNDGHVVIEDGLLLGEKIVVTGQQNLKQSSLVKVINTALTESESTTSVNVHGGPKAYLLHEPENTSSAKKSSEGNSSETYQQEMTESVILDSNNENSPQNSTEATTVGVNNEAS